MEYQVVLTLRSRRDLLEIGAYLHEQHAETATRLCTDLARRALALRTFPEKHPFLKNRRARKFAVGNYLIVYRVVADMRRVEILRFWHGAQNPHRLRLREEAAHYGQMRGSLAGSAAST